MCTAAAQDGHVHGDCRFTPFRLALVGVDSNCTHKFACLYESESGVWGDIVSVATRRSTRVANPSVLIRDSFCWLLSRGAILEFDFQSQSLAVTKKPTDAPVTNYYDYDQYDRSSYLVVRTEHNGLGLAVLSEPDYVIKIIQLWERKSNCDDVVGWELQKTIQLDVLILPRPWCMGRKVMMQGYDEDTNAIFLSTLFGDYMLQLESTQFINLNEIQRPDLSSRICYPYRNFYITGSGDGDQDAGAGMPMH